METSNTNEKWQFWPVMLLAFFYPVNWSLISLAIPLYFYKQGINILLIGIIAAGTTMTYCFSPLLFRKFGERIGRRKSLIIALLGTSLAQLVFYFSLQPFIFLISRIIEGFITGLFWTSLQSSISDDNTKKSDYYTSRYNFSWNIGQTIGLLIGAITLFFVNDVQFIFFLAPILVFINLIISILFFQNPPKNNIVNQGLNRENDNSVRILKESDQSNDNNNKAYIKSENYSISIILPFLYIASFCIANGSISFLYPIKSEIIGFETYTVYLLVFFALITQLISSTFTSYLSIRVLKKVSSISLIALIIIGVSFGITSSFIIFVLLFFLMGFFTGTLYAYGLKLAIMLNKEYNTSKYSNISESTIGITALITPIVSGYIAGINLNLGFYFVAILFSFILILNFFLIRKLN